MIFKEFTSSSALSSLVESYWHFAVPSGLKQSELKHIFPPDGYCSFICFYSSQLQAPRFAFMGPTTTIKEVLVYPGTHTIGIRLMPGCSTLFYPKNPSELLDTTIHFPEESILDWQRSLFKDLESNLEDIPQYLDGNLLSFFSDKLFVPDQKIIKAVKAINSHAGQIKVEEIASLIGLGQRQLQRLFKKQSGITVKKFCQITRLRYAIIDLGVERQPTLSMVVARGFTDMAHYYKSFRIVTGYDIKLFFKHVDRIEHHLK